MNNETDELSPQERQAFAALSKELMPPSLLEDRIVEKLKDANLIQSHRLGWFPGYATVGVAIAVALVIFAMGVITGGLWTPQPQNISDLPEFILILRSSNPETEAKSPEEELQRVKEYSTWAHDLASRGLLVGGEKLKDEGRFLGPMNGSHAVTETRSNAAEGAIAGYFLLPVSDYDQAVRVAKTCPHLKHGGTVEVRQIERF